MVNIYCGHIEMLGSHVVVAHNNLENNLFKTQIEVNKTSAWGQFLLGTTSFGDRFIYLMIQIENSFPFACTNGRPTYRTTFLTHVFFPFVYTNGRPT